MKIFTGNIGVIKNDIEYLLEKIPSIKDKDEMLEVFEICSSLISEYSDMTYYDNGYNNILKKNKKFYEEASTKSKKLSDLVIDNFIANKECHKGLALSLQNLLNNRLLDIDDFDYQNTNLTTKEQYEIIIDFFKSKKNIGINGTEVLDSLIREKRIFDVSEYIETCDGYALLNSYSKNATIYIDKSIDDVDTMSSIVHEVGHIIDFYNVLKKFSRKDIIIYETCNPYIEVMSKKYEKEFLEYLITNNIYPENAKLQLDNYYHSIFDSSENQLLLTLLDDYLLVGEKFQETNLEELINCLNKNSRRDFDSDEYSYINSLNLCTEVAYTYGGAIATYLSHLEKTENKKYEKVYQNFQIKKTDLFSPNIYDVLETNIDNIIDTVSKEMEILDKPKIKKYISEN